MFPPSAYRKLKRNPAVITPKDAGILAAYTGIGSGDRVLEAGGGSGFLTVFLANIVGERGRVYSYEIREDFAQIVRNNVEKAGFGQRAEIKIADVFEKIEEENLDAVFLDLAESEKALANAFGALKEGGYCAGYHPNVEQAKSFVGVALKAGFSHLFTIETVERELLVREQGCRPATKGLTHTGYLTFLKKSAAPGIGEEKSTYALGGGKPKRH